MVDTPTADSPREPDISHVNPASGKTWFGHPRQLARLFTTEAWERFGYYGMRALLTVYLTTYFLFSDYTANGLYGGFTALVYLTPLIGGLIADRYLGSKKSVKLGAIMMSLGYFLLCFGGTPATPYAQIDGQRYEVQIDGDRATGDRYVIDGAQRLKVRGNEDHSVSLLAADGSEARHLAQGEFEALGERSSFFTMLMLIALSLVTVGNGFFKPNISTIVGSLYEQGDRRRDAGFTIFYMGINLGSIFSQILCPILALGIGSWHGIGFWAGFGLAAVGMLISWMLIQFDGGRLDGYGEPPAGQEKDRTMLVALGAVFAVPVVWFLFYNVMGAVEAPEGQGFWGLLMALPFLNKLLYVTFILAVIGIPFYAWKIGNKVEFQMMVAAIILIVFNVVFWTLFEQAGSSLTLFANRNTDLSVFGLFSISGPQTQFFNPFAIVILAPLFSIMWTKLAKRGLEPSIPTKFAIALMGAGAGFLFLVWGSSFAGPDFKVGLWWLAGLYLIHSMAELCISPVGLSMITKLSIARVVGLMMGVWFLSISVAQSLAGLMAQAASVETVGGQVTNLEVSLNTYTGIYKTFGLYTIGAGVVLLIVAPLIRKWMHGVK